MAEDDLECLIPPPPLPAPPGIIGLCAATQLEIKIWLQNRLGKLSPVNSRKGSRSREVLIDQEADSDRTGEDADTVKHFGQGRGRGLSSLTTTRTREEVDEQTFLSRPQAKKGTNSF